MSEMKIHNFEESEQVGRKAEEIFEQFLVEKGIKFRRHTAKMRHDVDFVVEINGVPLKIDIKNDVVAQKTGNLALEVKSSNNRDGWLVELKPHVIIFFVGDDIYVMHREDFRYLLDRMPKKVLLKRLKTVRNRGRDGREYFSIVLLVPLKELYRYKAHDMDHIIKMLEGIVRNHHLEYKEVLDSFSKGQE